MKKFKHILVCGLAVVASAVVVQAQTLTQDWKVTKGLPAAANARWGIGFDGKVYINDKSVPQIILLSTGNCKIINLSEENILWGFKF